MNTQSAKAKGRALQQWVAKLLIEIADPMLSNDDVKSASSGQNGEDVVLSSAARCEFPVQIECKSRKSFKGVYDIYKQAESHGKFEPVVVIKQNRSKPLAIVDAETLFELYRWRQEW